MITSGSDDQAMDRETQLLPARMINEFVYCPRLFYLEYAEGLFAHNALTVEGESRHRRVDAKSDALPPADAAHHREPIHARSVTLASDRLNVIAKLDLVETQGNLATPIDYKRGSPKLLDDGSLGAWEPERIQLCIQALVLRDNGYQCNEGILFFWETRQRVRIAIDDCLVQATMQAISQAQQTIDSQCMPLPLVNSPKCPKCSLVSICLPDETTRCAQEDARNDSTAAQPLLFDIGLRFSAPPSSADDPPPAAIRQLITARDEKRPLYLNTQNYTVGISGQVLKIKDKTTVVQEVRLNELNQVNLFGNVQVSTQAIQALLAADIPLIYFSFGGWFHGVTQPVGLKNVIWRREQFRMADRPGFCLALAKQLVSGKIRNQRTLLMRNHTEPPKEALRFLKSIVIDVEQAEDLSALLGFEGLAARVYFQNFSGMLKLNEAESGLSEAAQANAVEPTADDSTEANSADSSATFTFEFRHRNRRPPRDPVNALLSLGYSLLAKDLSISAAAVGLDPYMEFYHQPRFGRPALALDLMEPFRPLVVDSVVLSAVNQRMVTAKDFVRAGDSVALTASGRKGFFRAYEQRMDQLVTHPLFGYRVSYRRLLEIQTRLLARVLLGELREYPVFVTR